MHKRSFLPPSFAIARVYNTRGALIDEIRGKRGRLTKPVGIATTSRPLREEAGQVMLGGRRAAGMTAKVVRS